MRKKIIQKIITLFTTLLFLVSSIPIPAFAQSVPNAPSGLSATVLSSGIDVNLAWDDNSSDETEFKLYRKTASDSTWTFIGSAAVDTLAYFDYGLQSGSYDYYVEACNATSCSGQSNWAIASTGGSTIGPPTSGGNYPTTPSGLTATLANGTDVTLAWDDNSSDETEFKLYRKLVGDSYWYFVGSAGSDVTTYTDISVPNGSYEYYVEACHATGCSGQSNWANATIAGSATPPPPTNPPTTPSAISDLRVSSITGGSATLEWTAPGDDGSSGNASFYDVQYSTSPLDENSFHTVSSAHAPYPQFAGTKETLVVNGLAPSTTYYFAIKTGDSDGNVSSLSNIPSATTQSGTDTSTPYVTSVNIYENTDGTITAEAYFSEDIDQSALTHDNIFFSTDVDNTPLGGTIETHASWVKFTGSFGTASGVYYRLTIKKEVSDLVGNDMDGDHVSWDWVKSSDFWVEDYLSYPYYGETNIPVTPTVHLVFSKTIDPSTIDGTTVLLAPINAQSQSIASSFTFTANGFDIVPIAPLSINTSYSVRVTTGVTSLAGERLSWESYREFTTGASTEVATGKISGTVFDADGTPVADASLDLYNADYSVSKYTQSLSDGSYSFGNLPAGTYTIKVHPPYDNSGGLLGPAPVDASLSAGQSYVLDFSFLRSVKVITGTVTRTDNAPVTDARIGAYQPNSTAWAETQTDSSGSYQLRVSGGGWEMNIWPAEGNADWFYENLRVPVQFTQDFASEEKVVNFTVVSADAAITGRVLGEDGSIPRPEDIWVEVRTQDGSGGGSNIDTNGIFSLSVPAGTYSIHVWTQDAALFASTLSQTRVDSGTTLDVGVITLGRKTDHIVGRVVDEQGNPLSQVSVQAFVPDGAGYASVLTDASGNFDLLVTPGTWYVEVMPDPSLNFSNQDPPQKILVEPGSTNTVNFTLQYADALISGKIVDQKGNILTDVYGYAFTEVGLGDVLFGGNSYDTYEYAPSFGGPIERGRFSFKVPAGTYDVGVHLPPQSGYTPSDLILVHALSGETTEITISVKAHTSKITGVIKRPNGNPITNIDFEIFAKSEDFWQDGTFDRLTGTYTINVSAGRWLIGYWVSPESGYVSAGEPNLAVTVSQGATIAQDIVLTKADATITGLVTRPDGTPIPGVWIDVTIISYTIIDNPAVYYTNPFVAGGETDKNGVYTVQLPAGTYYIHAYLPPTSGLINPEEEQLGIKSGETKTVDLAFRNFNSAIVGTVLLGEKTIANAFVWAWSEKSGYTETRSDSDGYYSLHVTEGDTWHVGAAKEIDRRAYKSSEVEVRTTDSDVKLDLALSLIDRFIPEPEIQTVQASQPVNIALADGAGVALPANSAGTSGSITINMTPETEAVPSQGSTRVVGSSYNIEVVDDTGNSVTQLNQEAIITLPYTEEDLAALGATEGSIAPSFWDETAGVWKPLENYIIDTENNEIIVTVDHLTRFAIVAAADIVPPSAPTSILATNAESGLVQLTWKNPSSDFSHVKIYRSIQSEDVGDVVYNDIQDESKRDSGLEDGATYYYTLRAVDPAGNESKNTNQTAITVRGTSVKIVAPPPPSTTRVSASFNRNLLVGSTGNDVTSLQQLLVRENVYPQALITGYFGSLTKAAVVRFQDKYASEVLAPVGLTSGTGFVGLFTRVKLNSLIRGGTSIKKSGDTSNKQISGGDFTRSLAVGMRGNEVTSLQQLLVRENVYPQALITGYFGSLTKAAVVRFQDKYASEVLAPVGLSSGSGYFGPSTIKKANQLIK